MTERDMLVDTVDWAIRELASSMIVDHRALEVRRRLQQALRPSHTHDISTSHWDPKGAHSQGDCRPECERRLDAHRDKLENLLERVANLEGRT